MPPSELTSGKIAENGTSRHASTYQNFQTLMYGIDKVNPILVGGGANLPPSRFCLITLLG